MRSKTKLTITLVTTAILILLISCGPSWPTIEFPGEVDSPTAQPLNGEVLTRTNLTDYTVTQLEYMINQHFIKVEDVTVVSGITEYHQLQIIIYQNELARRQR